MQRTDCTALLQVMPLSMQLQPSMSAVLRMSFFDASALTDGVT